MKPSLTFTIVFILITLLEMAGDVLAINWLHYTCKPLIMILLMGYTVSQRMALGQLKSIRWLLVGMVFALLGDVFLMIQGINLFAAGLGSFLLMQLCYIAAFRQSIREVGQSIDWARLAKLAVLFLIYAVTFLYFVKTPFDRNPANNGLWIPVVVYVGCICSMSLMAAARQRVVPVASYRWVLAGALLFMVSDSALAINTFVQPFALATFLIMTTYAAAQYLIVVGMHQSAETHETDYISANQSTVVNRAE